MSEVYVVPPERAGIELDECACLLFPGVAKGFLRGQIRAGRVLVDGQPGRPSQRLRRDQVLMIEIDDEELPDAPVAPPVEVPVLYEDDDVLVVDKPADLAVEPERWHRHLATLSGAVLSIARERAEEDGDTVGFRPRIVHRLDKHTTGCVVVAKHLDAERRLRDAFAHPDRGEIDKRYLALVEGEHPLADGESELIDLALRPDEKKSGRMVVAGKGGKPAATRVEVVERFRGYTLLGCRPLTGRTHQIRVHLAALGFPLAVDSSYGRRDALYLSELKAGYRPKRGRVERPLIDRLTLHAASIRFPAPGAPGGAATASAPLPADFERVLKQMRKVRGRRR